MIYFIGNRDLDVCKIGFSKRPNQRIKQIQYAMPFELEIFDIIKGDMTKEKQLHNQYEEYNIHGEWFVLSGISTLSVQNKQEFLSDYIVKSDSGYILLSSAVRALNNQRFKRDEDRLNITQFFKREDIKVLIISMENRGMEPVIKKQFGKWLHPYLFIELCRSSGAREKLEAYENLEKLVQKN